MATSFNIPTHNSPFVIIIVATLLLRSRLLSIPKDALDRIKVVTRGNKLTPQELAQVLQQAYIKEPDGSKTLLVPYLDRISKVCSVYSLTE